ncbi:hypothetical protein RRF57_003800 [Xylaria bambusicola]|uniref:Uncharacterized protein n=1 Tax=Xylaria bambusicola TaxID=326684 RepID=A0AAN7Z7X1_9PEZI
MGVGVGVVMGVIMPVLVLLPERVVVLMGTLMVVSQRTPGGRRRGSKIAGGQCRTKAAVLVFTIAGVHSGGGQDSVTATINGPCTARRKSGKNERTAEPQIAFDATHVVE